MTKEDLKELKSFFPAKVEITQKILDTAIELNSPWECIGALALKSFLPKKFHDEIWWGSSIGFIGSYKLKTEDYNEDIGMYMPLYLLDLKAPRTITFVGR